VISSPIKVAEYFAGIGLARIGMEQAGFHVVWSNDISEKKAKLFRARFGDNQDGHRYDVRDLNLVRASDIPTEVDVAWASFPCTDLSLAGTRGGIHSGSSAAFWSFARNLAHLGRRRPKALVIENVTGFASSHGGKDISLAIRTLNSLGYSMDVLSLDARRFVPQSRPRLFLIGVHKSIEAKITESDESSPLRPAWIEAVRETPDVLMHRHSVAYPPDLLDSGLSSVVDKIPEDDERWWSAERAQTAMESLSDTQLIRLSSLQSTGQITYRTAYRRMRAGIPRWELRPDDLSGCLRTARGGSSRQAVVRIDGDSVRWRWMAGTEYAQLMGAEGFDLTTFSESEIQWGFGDAVCVPAVKWIAEEYLAPILTRSNNTENEQAFTETKAVISSQERESRRNERPDGTISSDEAA